MLLSSFFTSTRIVRDAEVSLTFSPEAMRSGAVCYALTQEIVEKANGNPNIAAILTTPDLAGTVALEKGCVASAEARTDFYALHNEFCRSGAARVHDTETTVDVRHGVSVGARSVVGGNARIGNGVWIGPSSVISDAIEIGENAQVKLGSVVVRNVRAGESVSGNFALSHAQHLRLYTRDRHGA